MAEYAGRLPLFHVDSTGWPTRPDALAGGFVDERQATGVTIVEWPERMGTVLPVGASTSRSTARRRAADDHAAGRRPRSTVRGRPIEARR
jgi:tRNA A37 threonylcarbamoyladenosine biosynthesis protein TsaE